MLKKILLGVAALVAILLVVAGVQPSEYHVERSTEIKAPPEIVWSQLSDFSRWKHWNAWEKEDPTQKTTVTGEPGKPGHKSSWSGEKTGRGSMEIVDAKAPTHLGIKLTFIEPMTGEAKTALDLSGNGEMVNVTWSMDGTNDFMGKLFSLFMDMEQMIGSKYEEGLANVKGIAEVEAVKHAEAQRAAAAAAIEAAPAP